MSRHNDNGLKILLETHKNLRAHSALADDPWSGPCICRRQLATISNSCSKDLWNPLMATCTHMHRPTNIHMILKNRLEIKKQGKKWTLRIWEQKPTCLYALSSRYSNSPGVSYNVGCWHSSYSWRWQANSVYATWKSDMVSKEVQIILDIQEMIQNYTSTEKNTWGFKNLTFIGSQHG